MMQAMIEFAMGTAVAMTVGFIAAMDMAGGFKPMMKEVFGIEFGIATDTNYGMAGSYFAQFGEAVD